MSTAPTAEEAGERAPILQVRGLARSYPAAVPVQALREASFDVHAGDLVTIVGPSGSGKSTLLQLLGLLDRPTAGSYLLDGQDTARLSERERCWYRATSIGFVFQSFHLLDSRSAMDNVALGLTYRGTRRRVTAELAAQALARVGLDDKRHQPTKNLSGGERQRVAIARALVGEPSVLLCDEPTGNLDSVTGAATIRLVEELNSQGSTVLLITHDAGVAAIGNRRFRIVDGVLT